MKNTDFLSIFLLLVSTHLLAQNAGNTWYEGEIQFRDNSKIIGMLQADFLRNSVLLHEGVRVKSVSPKEAISFEYYDPAIKITRRFVSITRKNKPLFYEIILNGSIRIIREEKVTRIAQSGFPNSNGIRRYTGKYIHDVSTQYFLEKNGEIYKLNKFSKYSSKLFGKSCQKVYKYALEKNIDLSSLNGKLKAVHYFNQTQRGQHVPEADVQVNSGI